MTGEDNVAMGNYLMLLEASPLYDTSTESKDESQSVFKKCFPGGFAWELLDVFSGKPVVIRLTTEIVRL